MIAIPLCSNFDRVFFPTIPFLLLCHRCFILCDSFRLSKQRLQLFSKTFSIGRIPLRGFLPSLILIWMVGRREMGTGTPEPRSCAYSPFEDHEMKESHLHNSISSFISSNSLSRCGYMTSAHCQNLSMSLFVSLLRRDVYFLGTAGESE